MEIFYKIRRIKDGKYATQTRFFGKTSWGKGQVFVRYKAAKSNFSDLIYKKRVNFPWTGGEVPERYKKTQPAVWGTLQLVKFELNLEDGTVQETIMREG